MWNVDLKRLTWWDRNLVLLVPTQSSRRLHKPPSAHPQALTDREGIKNATSHGAFWRTYRQVLTRPEAPHGLVPLGLPVGMAIDKITNVTVITFERTEAHITEVKESAEKTSLSASTPGCCQSFSTHSKFPRQGLGDGANLGNYQFLKVLSVLHKSFCNSRSELEQWHPTRIGKASYTTLNNL